MFTCDDGIDRDQWVNAVMPKGIRCGNSHCPYNDIAYNQWAATRPNASYEDKICLNCFDDWRQDIEEMRFIYHE